MADQQKEIIRADNLTFAYRNGVSVLKDFSLAVKEGAMLGILGPNGAGKSTVLKLLSGFIRPISGRVTIKGKNLTAYTDSERAAVIAAVPQNVLTAMPYTVQQVVEMGRASKVSRLLPLGKGDTAAVENALEEIGITHLAGRKFNELSGGEKQMVKIAAALAQEPEILLLDEPTSQLDLGHGTELMRLVKRLNCEKRITVVIVSHDIQNISLYLNRLVVIKQGRTIVDGIPGQIITPEMIEEVYSCRVKVIESGSGSFSIVPEL